MNPLRLVAAALIALMLMAPLQAQQIRNQPAAQSIGSFTVWNSSTALNATQTIYDLRDSGFDAVTVHLVQSSGSFSAGAITFEVTFDSSNWITVAADAVHDPTSTTWATISLPYTLVTSTNKAFLVHTKGWQALRIKLSTAITGTGTVTINAWQTPDEPVKDVIALSPTAANFNDTSNVAQFGGSNVVTGTGSGGSGIPRVTISSDSSLAANQSVNVAQMNGVAVTMGNGTSGTGVQRVAVASDNSAVSGFGVGATAAAVPANAVYLGGNGTGNLTGFLRCDNSVVYDTNTNGKTQLVGLTSGQTIYVCGFSITQSTTSAVTVSLGSGTGTNCGTTYTAKTPAYPIQAPTSVGPTGIVHPPGPFPWFTTAASEELCISTNAGVSVQALVSYTKF